MLDNYLAATLYVTKSYSIKVSLNRIIYFGIKLHWLGTDCLQGHLQVLKSAQLSDSGFETTLKCLFTTPNTAAGTLRGSSVSWWRSCSCRGHSGAGSAEFASFETQNRRISQYRIAAKYSNKSVFQHRFEEGCRITS